MSMNIIGGGTYYQVVDQEQAKQVLSRIEEISDKSGGHFGKNRQSLSRQNFHASFLYPRIL